MPTKPVAAFTFATNTNYSTGPAVGLPTKIPAPDLANGFIPGQGIAAEHVNTPLNVTGLWLTNWVSQGSAAAGEDAHIVETSVVGRIAVIGGNFGSPAKDATVVNADNNSALATVKGTNAGSGSGGEFHAQRTATKPILELKRDGAGSVQRGAIGMDVTPVPSAPAHCDMWANTAAAPTTNVAAVSMRDAGTGKNRRVWGTEKGYFAAHFENLGDTIDNASAGFVEALQGFIDPQPGKYMVHFSCSGRNTTGGMHQILVKFSTGAGKSAEYEVALGTSGRKAPFAASWLLDITGITELLIEVESSTVGLGVAVSDCEITVTGAYDLQVS